MRLLLIFLLGIPFPLFAADSLLLVIPAKGKLISTDESGNIYLLRSDQTLTRFDSNGDSTGFYRSVFNGELTQIDATNPLRIVLFYAQQKKIVVLDRMLTKKSELDLRSYHSFMPTAVCTTPEGYIYVYDYLEASLFQINESGKKEKLSGSNDLRQELGFVPEIQFMTLRERRLYLADSSRGVFVFDIYGTYMQTLPITGITFLQLVGKQLVYRQGSELMAYNTDNFTTQQTPLPAGEGELLQAMLARERFYLLYEDRLEIWLRR